MTKRATSADLESVRALLLAERASILGSVSSKLDVLELLDKVSAEDQAPLLHDQAVALHCRTQEMKKLKKILQGLVYNRHDQTIARVAFSRIERFR
jgi:RNA polymerase-binding transcription factor DksA